MSTKLISVLFLSCLISCSKSDDFKDISFLEISIPTITKQNLDAPKSMISNYSIILSFSKLGEPITHIQNYYYHVSKTKKELMFKIEVPFFKDTYRTIVPLESIKSKQFKVVDLTKLNCPSYKLIITSKYTDGFVMKRETLGRQTTAYKIEEIELFFRTEYETERIVSMLEAIVDSNFHPLQEG